MPENILEVAAEKSAHMQADVEKRTLRARSVPLLCLLIHSCAECFRRLCKAPQLMRDCLSSSGMRKEMLLEELRTTIELIREHKQGI